MATPVLDALLSGDMSDKRGLADSLGRLRSVGSLLQGGSSQNQAMGVGLENEANARAEQLRRIGESNRDNLARLRSAQIGAAAKMASAGAGTPSKSKWSSYADTEFDTSTRLGRDLMELQRLMTQVENEGGEAAQPVLAILKDAGANIFGERGAKWATDNFKTDAQKQLGVHLNSIDSAVRNKLYGSALTQGEIGYSLGNLLEGATTTDDLKYRVDALKNRTDRRLKGIQASFQTNPYLDAQIDEIVGGQAPAAGGPAPVNAGGGEVTPTDKIVVHPETGAKIQIMSDGSGVEIQ